jgi:hypothetical protein
MGMHSAGFLAQETFRSDWNDAGSAWSRSSISPLVVERARGFRRIDGHAADGIEAPWLLSI